MNIAGNAMQEADHTKQYHLASDESVEGLGGIVFQLKDSPAGTEALDKHKAE